MLDRSTVDGASDEVVEDAQAAAPREAVGALVGQLDDACRGRRGPWTDLVAALRERAAELARGDRAAWRLAVGSAVPLGEWTAGSWAAALRAALLADGFTRRGAERAVDLVAVHLQRTCPAEHGAAAPPAPLGDYPALERLRRHLSTGAEDGGPGDGADLLARVEGLRDADRS